jgi:hypothetical protein
MIYEDRMKEFKDRYVLGVGYPWAFGEEPYQQIGINIDPEGINSVILQFPNELWDSRLPKYRLVLEKISE